MIHLVIPVSQTDVSLLPQMADVLVHHGSNRGHILTVVYNQDVVGADVQAFCDKVKPLFDSVDSVQVTTPRSGWPIGANQMFRECAIIAAKKQICWLHLELDALPTRKGWLQEISNAYELSGKPFMGCIVPTRGFEKLEDGTRIAKSQSNHMVGGMAVFHWNFANASAKLGSVDRIFIWSRNVPLEPWDIAVREEVIHKAQHSDLFQHNLRTVNYRVENGQWVCDNAKDNAQDHSKPVNARAAIVHGCKDSTLARLIISGSPLPEHPVLTASSDAALSGGNDKVSSSVAPADGAVSDDEPITVAGTPPERPKPMSFIATKIHRLLGDGKNRRVKQVAAELAMEEKDIQDAIQEESSGLELNGMAGWVKLKTKVA